MRIVVGQIQHEADIFSPVKTTLEHCCQTHLKYDEDVVQAPCLVAGYSILHLEDVKKLISIFL